MIQLKTRTISLEDYHRMIEAGILTEDERVELLDGQIIPMIPIGSKHVICVNRLNRLLFTIAGDQAVVSVQNPIALAPHSEPEPDLALWKGSINDFLEKTPGPEQIPLVIEVADTSVDKDRKVKLPIYAEAGIAEMWLVDLEQQHVEVYTDPKGKLYATRKIYQKGETISIGFLHGTLAVTDIFGA